MGCRYNTRNYSAPKFAVLGSEVSQSQFAVLVSVTVDANTKVYVFFAHNAHIRTWIAAP